MRRVFSIMPPLAWLGLGGALLIFLAGWLIRLPLARTGELQGRVEEAELIPLLPGVVARGKVAVAEPGLAGVKVRVATYMRRNACTLEAELWRGRRRIGRTRTGCSWFPDLGWVEFRFVRAVSDLDPGDYEVRFRSPDSGPENAVALSGRAGEARIMLRPVLAAPGLPLWTWLARKRPDYFRLLAGLVLFLALGGAAAWLGERLRRRSSGPPPGERV